MLLTIDIETLPFAHDPERIAELARASVPANYKKPEAIEAWIAENADECHRKTSLDWRYARILCVGFAFGNDTPTVLYNADPTDDALRATFDTLLDAIDEAGRGIVWVGHNIGAFDIPMLRRNALRLRHPLAARIPWEQWGKGIDDTMKMWSLTNPQERCRIDDIARFLGVRTKPSDMDGSKVYDAWLAGEHSKIAAYCANDVEQVREVHRVLCGGW